MVCWGQKGSGHKMGHKWTQVGPGITLFSDCSGYLKDFFIQDTGTKDDHSMGVQHWTSTSGEGPGDSLLAVNNEGDRLALHSHTHTVPPDHGGRGSSG